MQTKTKILILVGLLFLALLLIYITDGITGQSEPGHPDVPPVYSTQGAVNDPAPLPPPLVGGTLPATVTPWPTPRVTPTFFLPTSQPDNLDNVDFSWRATGKVLRFVLSFSTSVLGKV